MIKKIYDICEKLFFIWIIVIANITIDMGLLVLLIKFFKVTIIGGIILSIPIITFIIMLSIFCCCSLITTWRE